MPKGVYQRTAERSKTDSERCKAWNKARIGKKRDPESVKRSAQGLRKYSCNDSYFENIDTPDKAYWMGFIAADGCLTGTDNRKLLVISLGKLDEKHLEKFLEAIESNHIVYQFRKVNQCGITVNSPKMYSDLLSHGITPRKSKTLKYPTGLPTEFNRDFIRGYFDGDGSFTTRMVSLIPRFSLYSGSKPVLESVLKVLDDDLSFSFPYKVTKNRDNYTIDIGAKKNVMKIYNYFYNDRNTYLTRKKDKIINREVNGEK